MTPFTLALSFQSNIVLRFLVFSYWNFGHGPVFVGLYRNYCSTIVIPNLFILYQTVHVHQDMGIKNVSVAQTQSAPCWTGEGTIKDGILSFGKFLLIFP